MTIRKLPAGGMWTPYPVTFLAAIAGIDDDQLLLDEAEGWNKAAYTFICPVSGTLDTLEFYCDFNSSDPATTLKVSFQNLDSDDLPDGNVDQYRIITVGDFATVWIAPGLMTDDGTDTGVKRTVTRGQKLACVVEFESSNTGDLIGLGMIHMQEDTVRRSVGGCLYNSGAWSRLSGAGVGALKYQENPFTGQEYYPMPEFIPANGLNITAINTGTTPDEMGLEFAFPANVRIGGASMSLTTSTDGAAFDCVLYDHANAVLDTVPMKLHTELFPGNGYTYWTVKFSRDWLIEANQPYKVTVKPSSATSLILLELSFADSLILSNVYGYRDNGNNEHAWISVSRTNNGTFSQTASLPLISLNITGVDMDAGGAIDDWEGDE